MRCAVLCSCVIPRLDAHERAFQDGQWRVIGYLKGLIAAKHPPTLTLDVHGVGYELDAPMSTFYRLPAAGEAVALHTHLVVREDAHTLFGFATESERKLFRALLKISGVGPKMALGILSGSSVEDFLSVVETENAAMLTRIPGIGRKTAERVIIEMRGNTLNRLLDSAGKSEPGASTQSNAQAEAFGALVALGYKPAEVSRLMQGDDDADASAEEMIRRALKKAFKP